MGMNGKVEWALGRFIDKKFQNALLFFKSYTNEAKKRSGQ